MLTGLISKQRVIEHGSIEAALSAQMKTILPIWKPILITTTKQPNSDHYQVIYELVLPGTKYRYK